MDSEWFVSDQSDYKKADAEFKANKYFYNDNDRPLNLLRQVEVGDTYSFSVPTATTRVSGRGIQLSSFHKGNSSINNDVDIIGYLPDGWEVELYRNDILVDYIDQPKNNKYEFKNLPVSLGVNTYKLIFYGPQGQIKEEEKSYLIDSQTVLKNQFGFDFSLTEDNRYLFEFNEDKGDQDQKDFSTSLSMNYGLTNNFSLITGTTFTSDPSKTSSNEKDQNVDTDFEFAGFNTAYKNFAFEYLALYANRSDKFLHNIQYHQNIEKILPTTLNVEYKYFDDIRTKDSYYFSDYAYDYLKANLVTNLQFSRVFRFPFDVTYEQAQSYPKKEDAFNVTSRISYNLLSKYHFTLYANKKRNYNGLNEAEVGLLFNRQFNKLRIRGEVYYNLEEEQHINNFVINNDYYFTQDFRTFFNWKRNYSYATYGANTVQSSINSYTVGSSLLNRNIGNFGIEYTWDTNYYTNILLTYSVGLGFDTENKKPIINGNSFGDNGVMNAKVFIDENNNDKFDKDTDEPIENGKGQHTKTKPIRTV
jgi:hypothetical protein